MVIQRQKETPEQSLTLWGELLSIDNNYYDSYCSRNPAIIIEGIIIIITIKECTEDS